MDASLRNGPLPISPDEPVPVSGPQAAGRADGSLMARLAVLPLAAVDGEGRVTRVNAAGRERWGHLEGLRLPKEVVLTLQSRDGDAVEPLPVAVGALRVLCARAADGEGWVLVGYADYGVVEAQAPDAIERLTEEAPVALMRMRRDGTVTYANAAAAVLTGQPVGVMLGRSFWQEVVHPDDAHRLEVSLRAAAQMSKTVADVRFRRADDEYRRAELQLHYSGPSDDLHVAALDVTEQHEVAAELLQSETRYQTFLEQSPIGIVHLGSDGTITFENHQLRMFTGEEPEGAWIGHKLSEVPGLDPRLGAAAVRMLEEGQPLNEGDVTYTAFTGDERVLAVHGTPIRQPERGIIGGALMVFDVTEDRARDAALHIRQRYESAETALQNAALSLSTERALLEEAARLIGETAQASQVFVLLPIAGTEVLEEEVRWARMPERSSAPLRLDGSESEALAEAFSGGALDEIPDALLEAAGGGEAVALPFAVEGERHGVLLLVRSDPDAQPWPAEERRALIRICTLLEMLWGRLRVEARYRRVVAAIEDGLFSFSFAADGRRVYSFATPQVERLVGCGEGDLVGPAAHPLSSFVHERDRAAVAVHDRALREGRESRLAFRVTCADGTERWLRESAAPSGDGPGVTIAGVLSDVTEQKTSEALLVQAKQDAEAASRMKTTFLATMSHELRTPLGAIKGFAELLEEEVAELDGVSAEVTEFTGVIRSGSDKVLHLVTAILDLARLQTDRVALERAPLPINPLVEAVAARYSEELEERGVALALDLAPGDPIAFGDSGRIGQVVDALLSNAAKFTESGAVTLRTEVGEEGLTVRVEDTGIGIEEAYLPELFEPFSQEDNRLNRDYEGSGLGLALARRLVEAMEGEIRVESERGVGTTFSVTLPLADG